MSSQDDSVVPELYRSQGALNTSAAIRTLSECGVPSYLFGRIPDGRLDLLGYSNTVRILESGSPAANSMYFCPKSESIDIYKSREMFHCFAKDFTLTFGVSSSVPDELQMSPLLLLEDRIDMIREIPFLIIDGVERKEPCPFIVRERSGKYWHERITDSGLRKLQDAMSWRLYDRAKVTHLFGERAFPDSSTDSWLGDSLRHAIRRNCKIRRIS